MASSAFQTGWQAASSRNADRRERKQALADEQRKNRWTDLHDKLNSIRDNASKLGKLNDPETLTALADVHQQMDDLYHPSHSPGALQRDWEWIKSKITRKQPDVLGLDQPSAVTTTATGPGVSGSDVQVPVAPMSSGGSGLAALTLPASTQTMQMPAAPATRTSTFTPKTAQQRQQAAERDKTRAAARLDIAAGGLTPEQEAQAESRKNLVTVTQARKDFKAMNPDATPAQEAAFMSDVMAKQYGITQRPDYKEFLGPNGESEWLDVTQPIKPGYKAVVPGAARGGGSDFWKTVTAKYGAAPTAAQIEAERQHWMALGARGSETQTVVDAAGNSRSIRVPTFGTGQSMPQGLTLPADATVSGSATLPADWPSDIEPPAAPIRPSADTGAAPTGTPSAGAAPSASPADDGSAAAPASTFTPVNADQQTRLQSLGLDTSNAMIAPPTDAADAQAALADAKRLGILNDVLGVAEYRTDPSKVSSTRGGSRTKFMELVQRINPNYDSTKWEAVQQARKNFTAGGLDAKIMNSLGLSVNHLNKLVTTYDALGNGDYPDVNAVRNTARVHTGYGGVAAVDSAANAVSGEMASTFKGSGAAGTDPEIESWRQQFNANMSPDAFQQSVETMTDLMASRLLGEAQTYVNTYGNLKGFPLLAPKTVKILKTSNTEGAKLMLEVNREAGGKDVPDDQPTTAAKPSAAKPQGGAAGATKTYRFTATDPKTKHQIGTNDDDPNSPNAKYFDVQTGKPVQ